MPLQQVKQFAAGAKLNHKVQVILRLERVTQFNDERVLSHVLHDSELAEHLLVATLFFKDKAFAHGFDGIKVACVPFAGQVNFLGEPTLANHFHLVEVFE